MAGKNEKDAKPARAIAHGCGVIAILVVIFMAKAAFWATVALAGIWIFRLTT